ncbi:hypothetical protein KP509_09G029100 [Ceratopteris richardii]|uniref:DUF4460 domain-containing protein n=1 Tax=Ceratopteris richardii TaxID=49495 RepID=A0A8T2U587_CERRI|nr:hypothetical protein KP509_09G029100 [Ceratopteris richardii]
MRRWLRSQPLWKRWRIALQPDTPAFVRVPCAGFCSERDARAPTSLKSHLRLLFKLIHPDLFHNQPVEQAVNQNSFQLLQEYLNAAKGGGSNRHLPYHFVFFIRHDAEAESLRKVEISLPPPQARYLDEKWTAADLLPSTRKALARLFNSCGLPGFDIGGLASDEELVCLSDLFEQASEILRKNEASAVDHDRRLAGAKNALRLGRGIRVAFRPPLSELSGKNQVESLEKLATSLDRAQDVNLKGHNLLIGDCYGVDALGNIWLRYEDAYQAWSHYLNNVDLSKAIANRRRAAERQVLEHKAARSMEVEMVFTHDALGIQPEYIHFLNSTIKDAIYHGAVGQGKFSQLPLRITCPDKELNSDDVHSANRDETTYMKVDQNFGYIAVPVWENLLDIYKYIECRGNEALEIREKLKNTEKHVEQVKLLVRRKLRLRELVFDRKLTTDMCLTACSRLIQFAPDLEKYMEGLAICISDEHRLPVEGTKSYLHLKWNFRPSEF